MNVYVLCGLGVSGGGVGYAGIVVDMVSMFAFPKWVNCKGLLVCP